MEARAGALALLATLAGCVDKPAVVGSSRSPDGRLIARLLRTGDRASPRLTLDVGLASSGPFTTIAELAERSEPFPLHWRAPATLEAGLPCATTRLRGQLRQQIMLPETRGPVTINLSRPAACRLPLLPMR